MENFEEIYYRYNPWWEGHNSANGAISRPHAMELLLKNLDSKEIVFLTGLRRIGKTTLLKLLIANLLERNAARPENIFFISLDDYMLSRYSLLEIIEDYRKIKKIKSAEKIFLFLDEVTYKQDYEIQLKNLYDLGNVKIFASSSSASIMRSKKPYLTGRYAIVELLPLDFKEFLEFKNKQS
jgi:predicted AAA+ superfamily ATPase